MLAMQFRSMSRLENRCNHLNTFCRDVSITLDNADCHMEIYEVKQNFARLTKVQCGASGRSMDRRKRETKPAICFSIPVVERLYVSPALRLIKHCPTRERTECLLYGVEWIYMYTYYK